VSAWDTYAVCPGCDTKYRAPFGDNRHLHFDVCPRCGEGNARWTGRFGSGWLVKTMRFIDGRWYERGVDSPDAIEQAERAEDLAFRKGCLRGLLIIAIVALATGIWTCAA
jgi:Zn-finger nucleic acid-binding protein